MDYLLSISFDTVISLFAAPVPPRGPSIPIVDVGRQDLQRLTTVRPKIAHLDLSPYKAELVLSM